MIFQEKMELDLTNVDFLININTFHDEIQDKLLLLTNMEMEFLRKFQNRVKLPQYHAQMIHEIRKIVVNIQNMYKDIKDYFVEMKITFIYDFIRKIQTLMVIGYNHLSQALLIMFDEYETQKKSAQSNQHNDKCTLCGEQLNSNSNNINKLSIKRLQKIDYTIDSIEEEQSRLTQQLSAMYDMMLIQKNAIDKLKPSLASKQIEEMKDHMETVIQENEKLFEEIYIMRQFELSNQIKNYQRPESIDMVCEAVNDNFKKNFIKKTLKAAQMLQKTRKYEQGRMISVQVQTADGQAGEAALKLKGKKDLTVAGKDLNFTTQSNKLNASVNNYQNLLAKQRKLNQRMNTELNHLYKQNSALSQEIELCKNVSKQIQLHYKELELKFQTLQEMYQKVQMELDQKNHLILSINQKQFVNNTQNPNPKPISNQHTKLQSFRNSTFLQNDHINPTFLEIQKQIQIAPNSKTQVQYEQTQTQTQNELEMVLLAQSEAIKQLKIRNQKNIIMLNEKEKKIRDLTNKLVLLSNEDIQIKVNLNHFIQSLSNKFSIQNNTFSTTQKVMQETTISLISNQHDTRTQSLSSNNSVTIREKLNQLLATILQKQQQQERMCQFMNNSCEKKERIDTIGIEFIQHQRNNDLQSITNRQIIQQKTHKKQQTKSISTQTNQIQLCITKQSNITRQVYTQTTFMLNQQRQNFITKTQKRTVEKHKQKEDNFYIKEQIKQKRIRTNPDTFRNSQRNLETINKKGKIINSNLNTFESLKIDKPPAFVISLRERDKDRIHQLIPKANAASISPFSSPSKPPTVSTDSRNSPVFHVIQHQNQNQPKLSTLMESDDSGIFSSRLKPIYLETQRQQLSMKDKQYKRLRTTLDRDSEDNNNNPVIISATYNNCHDKPPLRKFNKHNNKSHKRLISQITSSFRPSDNEQNNIANSIQQMGKSVSSTSKFLTLKDKKKIVITSNYNHANFCHTLPSESQHLYIHSLEENKKKTLLLSIQNYKTQNTSINNINQSTK